MEGCSKTSAGAESGLPDDPLVEIISRVPAKSIGAASGLPDDPLVEILSRVPAKSICRFKCVSKAWRDLISDPGHRKKLRQAMQGLFVQTCEPSEVENAKLARISFSFIDLALTSVPLDIDPCFPFLAEMTGIETFILDSCNGLLLFGQRQEPSHGSDGYIVCNPTTRQWSAVPGCGTRAELSRAYLAFDPAVSSHFHLVELQMPDLDKDVVSLHVYSSETGTWSQNQIDEQREQGHLEGWHHEFILDGADHQCAFVNGFLHLIVWGSDVYQHIIALDVQGKARRMISVPFMTDGRHERAFVCYLGQSQGHLHCMTSDSFVNEKLSTWVLQDYDTQEWVLKDTLYTVDVFGEIEELLQFQVVDIHQDCNVVLFFNQRSYELIAYNMDCKEVSVIAAFEELKFRSEFVRYIPHFLESPALTNKY